MLTFCGKSLGPVKYEKTAINCRSAEVEAIFIAGHLQKLRPGNVDMLRTHAAAPAAAHAAARAAKNSIVFETTSVSALVKVGFRCPLL